MGSHSRPVKSAVRPPRSRRKRGTAAAAEPLPTKQARSSHTVDRLLDAAEAVLGERGLEQATVPNIAARAGLSVGVVYRRFADKDALLRAVYERFFDRASTSMPGALDPERWTHASLAEIVRMIVGSMVTMHRLHREILRALTIYAQTHPDRAFRNRAESLNAQTIALVRTLLLAHKSEIGHPKPKVAIALGMFTVAATLRTIILANETMLQSFAVPDQDLGNELTRVFLNYLGVKASSPRRRVS